MLEASELMPDLEKEAILRKARPFDPLTHLEDLTQRFPLGMQRLRIGGVHPKEFIVMNNPYTGQPDEESFTNTGEHCLAAACAAEVIAEVLKQRGIITQAEADQATLEGLDHDVNKRIEVFRRNAVRAGKVPPNDVYSPHGYATIVPILLAQGYDQDTIAYIARAGRQTAHDSLKDFLMLQDGIPSLVPNKMVDKIVHLADDMTATSIPQEREKPSTVYLTTWERMVVSDFPKRYPFLWTEGLAFDTQGEIVTLADINTADPNLRWVRPYVYWQPFVSNAICREIQGIIDPKSQEKPDYFVKNLVNSILAPTG